MELANSSGVAVALLTLLNRRTLKYTVSPERSGFEIVAHGCSRISPDFAFCELHGTMS